MIKKFEECLKNILKNIFPKIGLKIGGCDSCFPICTWLYFFCPFLHFVGLELFLVTIDNICFVIFFCEISLLFLF